MVDSIQQRIVDVIEAKLLAMTDGAPATPVWHHVLTGDLDDISNTMTPCVGIDQGTEQVEERYGGCTNYALPLFLHFRFAPSQGVANLTRYRYYLALLQSAILADHNLKESPTDEVGLSINIVEDGNAPAIVGTNDTNPGGSLTVIVRYRTLTHNPYKQPGDN